MSQKGSIKFYALKENGKASEKFCRYTIVEIKSVFQLNKFKQKEFPYEVQQLLVQTLTENVKNKKFC